MNGRTASQPMLRSPAAQQPLGRRLLNEYRSSGWTRCGVVPELPDFPIGWTYSIGLCTYGFPELVIPDMPGTAASKRIDDWIRTFQLTDRRNGTRLKPGDQVPDPQTGGMWTVTTQLPKASTYGVPWALRLFGERYQVRALRMIGPPDLMVPPGSPWIEGNCGCGCQDYCAIPGSAAVGTRRVHL